MPDGFSSCPNERLKGQASRCVEGVSRLTAPCVADAKRGRCIGVPLEPFCPGTQQPGQHLLIPAPAGPRSTPTTPEIDRGLTRPALKPTPQLGIVACPYRILNAPENRRGWGNPREEVHHHQLAVPPAASETDQPSQGGIVAATIGSGRVQTDEHNGAAARWPAPAKPPAVMTIWAEASLRGRLQRRDAGARAREFCGWPGHLQRD